GYWLVASDGGVFTFGNAEYHGSTGGVRLAAPVVALAPTADGGGYWLLGRDGGVFTFGDAAFHGSAHGITGSSPAVGLVATHDGGGYWIVLADGTVIAEGDASSPGPAYSFEVQDSTGAPARWNPCETIPYVVVSAGAPVGWQNDVSRDIQLTEAATGISFVNAGTFSSAAGVPTGADLVISWAPSLPTAGLLGLTDYWYYQASGYTPQIMSASVVLLQSLSAGGGVTGEEPVLLHELGHVMGLAQVNGPEVMGAQDLGYTAYQAGDLAGLGRLGAAQGCAHFYQ
ncbi:MAG TPA: hypothetical protein VFH70_13020, partial [Acidimicrobiales bacterium]|nr:hypothetical protein [Acidimicrobiales bacterium]